MLSLCRLREPHHDIAFSINDADVFVDESVCQYVSLDYCSGLLLFIVSGLCLVLHKASVIYVRSLVKDS